MKKPTSKIRDEIAKLEEQLKVAEKRDAERIGRIALKAGLGEIEIEIEETDLQGAFEELAKRFRGGKGGSIGKDRASATTVPPGATAGNGGEA